MSTSRLETISPKLVRLFQKASHEQRLELTLEACSFAAERIGWGAREIAATLEARRRREWSPSRLHAELADKAQVFDEQYLDMYEQSDHAAQTEALKLFARARLATSLAFLLDEGEEALAEALYEALMAVEDSSGLLTSINLKLENSTKHGLEKA